MLTELDCRILTTARYQVEMLDAADLARIDALVAAGLIEARDDFRLTAAGDAAYWALRPEGERAAWIRGYLDENYLGVLRDLEKMSHADVAAAWRDEEVLLAEQDIRDAVARWQQSPKAWMIDHPDYPAIRARIDQFVQRQS